MKDAEENGARSRGFSFFSSLKHLEEMQSMWYASEDGEEQCRLFSWDDIDPGGRMWPGVIKRSKDTRQKAKVVESGTIQCICIPLLLGQPSAPPTGKITHTQRLCIPLTSYCCTSCNIYELLRPTTSTSNLPSNILPFVSPNPLKATI